MIGGYESIVLAVLARPISIRHVRFPRSFAAFNSVCNAFTRHRIGRSGNDMENCVRVGLGPWHAAVGSQLLTESA